MVKTLVGGCALALVLGCTAEDPGPATSDTTVVTPEAGGTVMVVDGPLAGATLTVPPGAVSEDTEITVRVHEDPTGVLPAELDPDADRELLGDAFVVFSETIDDFPRMEQYGVLFLLEHMRTGGLAPASPVVELLPDGLVFDVPVELTIPFDPADLKYPELASAVRIGHLSASGNRIAPTTWDPVAGTLTTRLDHFSEAVRFDGFSETLGDLGGMPGPMDRVVLPLDDNVLETNDVEEDCNPTEGTSDSTERFLQILLEPCPPGEPVAIDTTIPPYVDSSILLGHLTLMTVIFVPWADDPDDVVMMMQTRRERELFDWIMAQPGQVTFEQVYDQSILLNDANAFESVMTIHNVVRSINYTPFFLYEQWGTEAVMSLQDLPAKLAPLTDIDTRITDTVGGWYHMAGLVSLSLYNDGGWIAASLASFDEYVISGWKNDNFDCGEQVANLIASFAGGDLRERTAEAPPGAGCECSFAGATCNAMFPCCEGSACVVDTCVACPATAGLLGDTCDPADMDACCGSIICSPLSVATDFRCCMRDGDDCMNDADCCGGMSCASGTCACQTVGNPCLTSIECCAGSVCLSGACS